MLGGMTYKQFAEHEFVFFDRCVTVNFPCQIVRVGRVTHWLTFENSPAWSTWHSDILKLSYREYIESIYAVRCYTSNEKREVHYTWKLNILRGSSKKIVSGARIESEIGFLDIAQDECVFVIRRLKDASVWRNNYSLLSIPQNLWNCSNSIWIICFQVLSTLS